MTRKYRYDASLGAVVGPGVHHVVEGAFAGAVLAELLCSVHRSAYREGALEARSARAARAPGRPRGRQSNPEVTIRNRDLRAAEILQAIIVAGGCATADSLRRDVGGGSAMFTEIIDLLEAGGAIAKAWHGARRAGWKVTERGRELARAHPLPAEDPAANSEPAGDPEAYS
jgi:predicted transcriptional regulator